MPSRIRTTADFEHRAKVIAGLIRDTGLTMREAEARTRATIHNIARFRLSPSQPALKGAGDLLVYTEAGVTYYRVAGSDEPWKIIPGSKPGG